MKTSLLIIILFCAIAGVRPSAYAQDVREADIHEIGAPALTFGLINPERTYAGVGQTETIEIQVCDANGKRADGVSVRFSASGAAVIDERATADENGVASAQLVIGKEYPGNYYITVSADEPGADAASMQFLVHLDSDKDGLRDEDDCFPIDPNFQSCSCEYPGVSAPFIGDTLSVFSLNHESDTTWHQLLANQYIRSDPQSCPPVPADVYRANIDTILRDISASLDTNGKDISVNRLVALGRDATPYLFDRLSDYEHPEIIADAIWNIAVVEHIPNLMDYLDSIESIAGREYELGKMLSLFDKFLDDLARMYSSHHYRIIESYIGERESDILYELFLKSDGNETINELLESLLCRYGEGAPADYIYRHIKEKYHIDPSSYYCP